MDSGSWYLACDAIERSFEVKVGNKVKCDKVHINMVQHDWSALDFKHENVTKLQDTDCSETAVRL